jgi:TonB family protein
LIMNTRRAIRSRSSVAGSLAGLFIALLTVRALAADVKIIANSGIKTDTISYAEIKRIFLLESTSLADGTHVEPVLGKNGGARDVFLKEFLETNDHALREYYGTLVFTGKAFMPKQLDSDAEIVSYVARTRGAIAYVNAESSTPGVKVLEIISPNSTAQRTPIHQITPDYPETLKHLGIGGTVRLQVTILPNGTVDDIKVLGGNPILAESAVAAVKQWIYPVSRSRTTIEVNIPF